MTDSDEETTTGISVEELRNIRATALSYAQQNKSEGSDLLVVAKKYATFLTIQDAGVRQARTTAISYAQSNRKEGEDVLDVAKLYADFLEGK